MTLADNYAPLKESGNGVTTVFSGSWMMIAVGYERVYLENKTTGVQTLQTVGSDYTLSITTNGFSVTFLVAPASTNWVVVGRSVPQTQVIPYKTSSGFQGPVQENSFDKLTAITQELTDLLDRAPKLAIGSTLDLTIETPVAGNALVWNSTGDGIINSDTDFATAIRATSTTSKTPATGAMTFETQTGKNFPAGSHILVTSDANPSATRMAGTVTSYASGVLILSIETASGTGAHTDWTIRIDGERGATGPAGTAIPIATAGGTADVITADFSPDVTLTDKMMVCIIPGADNATTTPTFNPDALGAKTIVKNGGADLSIADIKALRPALLEYNLANTRWELMNPVFGLVTNGIVPGGRLTLTTATPVLTADVTATGTIYYTPYLHDQIPLYDGVNYIKETFAELSNVLANSAVGNAGPAAAAANKNYDMFVWKSAGVQYLTRGPAWSSDTSRGTGAGTTELERVKGMMRNKVAITNGPGAGVGLFVGTIRTGAGSQCEVTFGYTPAVAPVPVIGLWNAYNRVNGTGYVLESTNSWAYTTATFRAQNNGAGCIGQIRGLNEDFITATFAMLASLSSGSVVLQSGVGISSTTVDSSQTHGFAIPGTSPQGITGVYRGQPGLGFYTFVPLEKGGANCTMYGDNGAPTISQAALILNFNY